ncbi:hypothetical protein GE21DRAFT_8478 [Neurospora crassa]|uniref:Uncharacterized protein n=2 Tax=Neurospora crassa TaxID=5141 RepID=Q1K5U3_NEUCR|nr:hypothetical protein NCU07203 [Neurospora crassa OR74A]EAA28192.3 hypothetical protein NCU07203 [Neurospora crassa OR74A]KHE85766.1 hypothetical protein GE21DRAFT_8478 [Neurospora crassa]CAD71079.1 hypothetical protein [Neurospora crassa]|eukprot:XP_957428.3 hypothetical protein NCU07203 [Neurospora crassa OR74A]
MIRSSRNFVQSFYARWKPTESLRAYLGFEGRMLCQFAKSYWKRGSTPYLIRGPGEMDKAADGTFDVGTKAKWLTDMENGQRKSSSQNFSLELQQDDYGSNITALIEVPLGLIRHTANVISPRLCVMFQSCYSSNGSSTLVSTALPVEHERNQSRLFRHPGHVCLAIINLDIAGHPQLSPSPNHCCHLQSQTPPYSLSFSAWIDHGPGWSCQDITYDLQYMENNKPAVIISSIFQPHSQD